MEAIQFPISVSCPWCERGETLADNPATVYISCRCYECGKFYDIDLKNKRALKAAPKPKARPPTKRKTNKNQIVEQLSFTD